MISPKEASPHPPHNKQQLRLYRALPLCYVCMLLLFRPSSS